MAKRSQRKAARQTARAQRKAVKTQGKQERKSAKVAGRVAKKEAIQERKTGKAEARQERKATKANARLDAVREAAANLPEELTPDQMPLPVKVKATNYLKKRNRVIEDENDGELLGAQFIEERARQIAQRHDAIEQEIDDDPSFTDEERDEMIPEYEDVEEMILEEEANEFSFTGDYDNFLDPDSIAMLARLGKSGIDKYKEKRFAQGKKAFGQTKAQYEAKQKEKQRIAEGGEPDSPAAAAMAEIKKKLIDEKKAEALKDYTPHIIGGVIVLIIIGVAIHQNAKK